jgi:TPR repeat protein
MDMRSRFLDLCVALALLVSLPGAWPQSKGINPVLLAKANDGDAKSQSLIGEAYLNGFSKDGINVPQDFTLAEFWCRKAAEQGEKVAQFDMGVLYLRGLGVPQDNGKAADWFLKAANQGYARAQYQLATLFEEGQGRIQSHALAATFYRKAAEQGDAEAQFALGLLYDNGNGVPQDFTQAAIWYRKAAEQGHVTAQFNLGVLYFNGQGNPRSYAEAYFWLDLASSGNDGTQREEWMKTRDRAAEKLTPEELSQAQQRATKWFVDHSAKGNPQ